MEGDFADRDILFVLWLSKCGGSSWLLFVFQQLLEHFGLSASALLQRQEKRKAQQEKKRQQWAAILCILSAASAGVSRHIAAVGSIEHKARMANVSLF